MGLWEDQWLREADEYVSVDNSAFERQVDFE